jgi:YD repeat-containing protein
MQTTLNNQLTSRIDNNTLTHTYQYDANGNQTQSTGNNARIIEYTPFNKTKKLTNLPPVIDRHLRPPYLQQKSGLIRELVTLKGDHLIVTGISVFQCI